LTLLVINIFWSSPAINKLRRLPATSAINVTAECIALCLCGRTVYSTQWSDILAENHDFCIPHLYSTTPLRVSPFEYCNYIWQKLSKLVCACRNYSLLKLVLELCTGLNFTARSGSLIDQPGPAHFLLAFFWPGPLTDRSGPSYQQSSFVTKSKYATAQMVWAYIQHVSPQQKTKQTTY